ncbi:ferredoxin-type protein NapF [Rhodobacter capsulatus]|uniref:Ferredoxin-type protein NapF n=1 Tax=Rhodobacter capsulatus TaxID=1061 RepID=A0A4U1JRE2_RHOCA|nr:ferredoxin-type protein NapF [Rhodobacter capsulatus]TKD21392.1 ferredoxin-type protein NapF [Rhodobacter capsulatus]
MSSGLRPSPAIKDPRAGALSRRALLRGRVRTEILPRPPGAGAAFARDCSQCGACARACPEGIILRDGAGFPVLDLRLGACSFCGACTASCPTAALEPERPFPWRVAVGAGCLSTSGTGCRICEDRCDTGAIRFRPAPGGRATPTIDPAACTGCGACIAPCPAGALALTPTEPVPCTTSAAV